MNMVKTGLIKSPWQGATQAKALVGFSLLEVLITISLMTAVLLPAMVVVERQDDYLSQTKAKTIEEIEMLQLFDNLPPLEGVSDPMDAAELNATAVPRLSIYCDSANLGKTDPTTDCGAGEPDEKRAPYFNRTLAYEADSNGQGTRGVLVTVSLYSAANGGTKLREFSRDYAIEHYRVNVGKETNGTYADFQNKVEFDSEGNPWFPYKTTNNADDANALFFDRRAATCGADSVTWSPVEPMNTPPFNSYQKIKCDHKFYFRVTPNTTYDVVLHFVHPTGIVINNNCLKNATATTCNMAKINISTLDAGNVATTLETMTNYDVGAEVNQQQGYAISQTYRYLTPNNAQRLVIEMDKLAIAALDPVTADTEAYLAGIEVIRRVDY